MKIDKCHFGVREMNLLGFNFQPDGLRPNPDRIKTVVDAKVAKTRSGILKFLGLVTVLPEICPTPSRNLTAFDILA